MPLCPYCGGTLPNHLTRGCPYQGWDGIDHTNDPPKESPCYVEDGTYCKQLPDGTWLVAFNGDNIDTDHWHIAADGQILSIKCNNRHAYKRSDIMKHISEVCPQIELSFLYRG